MHPKISTVNRQQSLEADNYHGDSMAPRKNRQNDRQAICFLYGSSVVAASLSIAVASMQYADQTDQRSVTAEWGRPLFVSGLYATSCFILVAMAAYFEFHRSETFEAVHRGSGPVPFSVKFSVKGEKVNLYLRLGLAMFGVMSIGHVAVKFAEDAHTRHTTNYGICIKSILEMLFFVLQTLFILRYHRLVILRFNDVMGAGMVHLLTTNLCIWADISVGKIDKTLSYGSQWKGKSSPDYGVDAKNSSTLNRSVGHLGNYSKLAKEHATGALDWVDVSFYLLPTVSEYCLLAAALLYEITVRIGQPSFIEIERTSENKQTRSAFHDCRGCTNSAGSWFGILTVLTVIALTIVTAATPKYKDRTENVWKSVIILMEEAILCLTGIGFVVVAFWQIRKLKFSIATRQSHVEEFLLYTAFFFSANYTISTIILAADFEEQDRNSKSLLNSERYLLISRCTLNALELLQILIQTYMLQDSFHRCCDTIQHQVTKPGRQSIVALLGINLAFWIQQSFQLKNADIIFLIENDRGTYGWILFVVTMPISLFYRYHCTVCLSQCFNKLYEDETHRFEEIWRYRVDPFTDMVNPAMESICMYGQTEGNNVTPAEHKTSEASIEQTAQRRKAAFKRNKPWKTFDVGDGDIQANEMNSSGHNSPLMTQLINPVSIITPLDVDTQRQVITSNSVVTETDDCNVESRCITLEQSSIRVELLPLLKYTNHFEKPNDVNGTDDNNNQYQLQFPSHNSCLHRKSVTPMAVSTMRRTDVDMAKSTKIPPYRRQTQSLTLPRFSTLELETIKRETKDKVDAKAAGVLGKSPRPSFSKHSPGGQPIRRRRTLRNLETAKYRVLAAEIAHRMVIERGGTGSNGATPSPHDRLAIEGDVSPNHRTTDSHTATSTLQDRWTHHSSRPNTPNPEFRLASAMSETAAVTIAPIESSLYSPLPGKPSDMLDAKNPYKSRIRQSLFPSSSRNSLLPVPHVRPDDKSSLSSEPSTTTLVDANHSKSNTWSFRKSLRTSSFRKFVFTSDKRNSTLALQPIQLNKKDMQSVKDND